MGTVNFKNVGQGDSIIIEWDNEGKNNIGIIDCNLYDNKNPILDYLSQKLITEIEFIVLSHFHYDHFSGMPDLFKFCIEKKIKIKWFLHTLADHSILQIYDKIFNSKKIEKASIDFFYYLELLYKNISIDLSVNYHTAPIQLSNTISMSFFAPSEKTGRNIATQINRKFNTKEFTYTDINKFSTIIYIQNNDSGILLTSDAVKGCFRNLNKRINREVVLIQVPHHGSLMNIYHNFWNELSKKDKCPAVFSIGYEPKDKLPNNETVEFFDKLGFDVHSTNSVFGISEYFNQNNNAVNYLYNNKTQYLNHFSKKINTIYRSSINNSKYDGDQKFTF